MECERSEHMEEMISAYVDGELSPEEQRAVEQHVAACPACAALFDEYKELSTRVQGEFIMYTAPFDLEANVLQQIGIVEEQRQSRRMRAIGWVGVVLVVACMAAILLSPVGTVLLSVLGLIVRVTSNLVPLLWHQVGSQGLLMTGVVGVGAVVTLLSLFAMKKMMQSFAPGR